jgi:hypothetical protein
MRRRTGSPGQPGEAHPFSALDEEKRLEDILDHDIELLGLDVLVVGRQVQTTFDKISGSPQPSRGIEHVLGGGTARTRGPRRFWHWPSLRPLRSL